MRALLDTHAFLWWVTDDARLSDTAREVIADGRNEIHFSAASGWEIAIKARLGRLTVPDDLARFMTDQIEQNGFRILAVELGHALRVHSLEDLHRDPFDRMLVAQSMVENLPIIGRDAQITAYGVESIW
ncbi:MAG: type II toxin-antitoxin system VapC family toxin [Proteobacteria bacterium]|nr:type II toxin-antitoxin system VapC family toxin [Pseudomonadota bacterium]